MTIKDLRKYRDNIEKLACIERQLERRYTSETVQGSQGAPSYEKVSRIVDGYIHGAGTVSLLAEKSKLIHENEKIEEFIYSTRGRLFDALFYYCIDERLNKPTWNEVARMMGEKDDDALKKFVKYHLKKCDFLLNSP